MPHYGVIGVAQQSVPPAEWVSIAEFVEAPNDDEAARKAFNQGLDRREKSGRGANRAYPQWPDLKSFANDSGDWNPWTLAIVELKEGLPVIYADTFVDTEEVREKVSRDNYADGSLVPNLYVVAGRESTGDGWVQRFRGTDPNDAMGTLHGGWQEGDPSGRSGWNGNDWEIDAIFGLIAQGEDGVFRSYDPLGDLVSELALRSAAPVPSVASADLDVVNRHRASMGRAPLDLSAGWTAKEITDMAHNIRTRGTEMNPRHVNLKRKLMR